MFLQANASQSSITNNILQNEWKNIVLMDGHYVVGASAIPYPQFGMITNIIFKE